MKCKYSEPVDRYFDGELEGSLKKEVSEHLSGCPQCKKQIEILKTVKGSLKSYESLAAGDEFTSKIMEKIENRFTSGWIFNVRPLALKLVPAAAMVLLILGFISFSGLFEERAVSLEEALLGGNYTSDEKIVMEAENLSEYDVFRLTLN